jgi:tellurite resistance protein
MRELSPDRIQKLKTLAAGGRSAHATVTAADPGFASRGISSERDAIVEAMFLLAAVDGDISAAEIRQFGKAASQVADGLSDEQLDSLVSDVADALRREGWDRRLRAAADALRGKPSAEIAYRLATAVAFVDDEVAHAEAAALDALAAALGLSAERAHELMTEAHRELFG